MNSSFFVTAKRGWFPEQPGHSCKDILDSGHSIGDGEYWIDPENNAHPFSVHCDMTTDGGKYHSLKVKSESISYIHHIRSFFVGQSLK